MNIAVIPARGGSKRIPRKNIRMFLGKPIIAYSIELAINSKLFDHIIVSTDDDEIAEVSKIYGAEVPFKRPANLANDFAATQPVIKHAVNFCNTLGWGFSNVCCIYPAAPLVQLLDIKNSYEKFIAADVDYCFPVAKMPCSISRALNVNQLGLVDLISPQAEGVRTQDLAPAYYDAGQFYWGKASAWLANQNILSGGLAHIIPQWRTVDIDNEEDWVRAEMLAQIIFNG